MEGHCSTGQSPQWAVVPMEEEEEVEVEEEEEEEVLSDAGNASRCIKIRNCIYLHFVNIIYVEMFFNVYLKAIVVLCPTHCFVRVVIFEQYL